jgi:hypothetical protein
MTSSLPNFLNYILRYPKQCSKFNVVLSKIQVKQVFRSKKYNQTTMTGHGNAFPCNTIMYWLKLKRSCNTRQTFSLSANTISSTFVLVWLDSKNLGVPILYPYCMAMFKAIKDPQFCIAIPLYHKQNNIIDQQRQWHCSYKMYKTNQRNEDIFDPRTYIISPIEVQCSY